MYQEEFTKYFKNLILLNIDFKEKNNLIIKMYKILGPRLFSNAKIERYISLSNLIKTCKRNNLDVKILDITINNFIILFIL